MSGQTTRCPDLAQAPKRERRARLWRRGRGLFVALPLAMLLGCASNGPVRSQLPASAAEQRAALGATSSDAADSGTSVRRLSGPPAPGAAHALLADAFPDAETWLGAVFAGNLELERAQRSAEAAAVRAAAARARLTPTATGLLAIEQRVRRLDLSAVWLPDLHGALHLAAEAEAAQAQAEAWLTRAAARTLWQSAWAAALTWLATEESLRLNQAALALAERTHQLVGLRYAAGAVSGLDLALAESALAASRLRVQQRQQATQTALDALAELEGRPRQAEDRQRLQAWLGHALPDLELPRFTLEPEQRFDVCALVQAAEWRLHAAQAEIESLRAAVLPELELRAGGSLRVAASGQPEASAPWLTTLAARLAAQVFDGGRRRAERQLAELRYRELLGAYRQQLLATLAEAEQAERRLLASHTEQQLEAERLTAARRAAEIAEQRYRAGRSDALNLLAAQATVLEAAERLLLARLSGLEAWLALYGPLELWADAEVGLTESDPPRRTAPAW